MKIKKLVWKVYYSYTENNNTIKKFVKVSCINLEKAKDLAKEKISKKGITDFKLGGIQCDNFLIDVFSV